ncbi:hypothetical protein NL676_003131 [Syzygium grande]|nr:hypothetical protein NL676_003131 [Syzygium grande]
MAGHGMIWRRAGGAEVGDRSARQALVLELLGHGADHARQRRRVLALRRKPSVAGEDRAAEVVLDGI